MKRTIAHVFQIAVAAVLIAAFAAADVLAQQPGKGEKPGLFKGLTQNRTDPVKISAARLEVRDKDKRATFSGSVHVIQGDTEITCDSLIVFYESDGGKGGAAKAAPKTQTPGSGNQQIRRMEAKGSVKVTQKEQRAHGDLAEFDMRKNTVVLKGNVVIARGDDVLRGETLFVDLTSGVSRMESGGGRVEGMFKSSPGQQPKMPGRAN